MKNAKSKNAKPKVQAIIYVITCIDTEKQYVGQTKTHKLTREKWYKYGIVQRFAEHTGAARRNRTTPLAQEIGLYGKESFEIEEICRCSLEEADEWESYYIKEFATLVPNGYNVQESSRHCKGSCYTKGVVLGAEMRGIRKQGVLAKVRLLLDIKGEQKRKRIMFGTNPETFYQSILDARLFCEEIGVVPREHSSLADNDSLWWPYKEKIEQFDDRQISRLKIIPYSSKLLVKVCVMTEDMKSWTEEVHISFGGKNVKTKEALKIAISVCEELKKRHKVDFSINKLLKKG